MSSSAVQQEQLPCARSNYFLNHKRSCSTTSCRRGRCTRRNLLLGVCVHPLFTHQQLSQYTAFLSGPRRIETDAALTDHFNYVVTWNAMILGHVKCGQGQKALELFQQMQQEGMQPDSVTFVGVLNACASVVAIEEGRCVHQQIIQSGLQSDVFVCNNLVDMYAKCGSVEEAWRVFNKMPSQDVITWNAVALGHVKCGQGEKALELFQQMQQEGVRPNSVTFVGVLNACASVVALEEGRCVHQQIIQSGCESEVFVGSSLVDMYAKCGSIEEAWRVFNKICHLEMWSLGMP
ncbi:unnamed protein product [Sphagnum tenellum]